MKQTQESFLYRHTYIPTTRHRQRDARSVCTQPSAKRCAFLRKQCFQRTLVPGCSHNGKQADRFEAPWEEVIPPEMLADALKKIFFEVVTIVHNETSTGAENPLKELASVVHEVSPETLILVDAVSSLGGVKIETDDWGLDFILISSQKWLALPPGMSFAAVSDRVLK
jgi:aspartate aminotransferase-like enzyme